MQKRNKNTVSQCLWGVQDNVAPISFEALLLQKVIIKEEKSTFFFIILPSASVLNNILLSETCLVYLKSWLCNTILVLLWTNSSPSLGTILIYALLTSANGPESRDNSYFLFTTVLSAMQGGLGPNGNRFPTYEMDSLVFSSACFCLLRPFR